MTDPIVEDNASDAPRDPSIFATRLGATALASVLIQRLGGKVVLTKDDFEKIQGTICMEGNQKKDTGHPDTEALAFWLQYPSERPRTVQ
jgi:hypothetical protein